MNTNKLSEKITDNVFQFYADNKKICDKWYNLAEDSNIDKIYDDIDEITKKELFSQTAIVVLTANKYENNVLHQKIYQLNKKQKKIHKMKINLATPCDKYSEAFAYWFEWNDYSVLHINANVTGSYTIGGSADIVKWVINNPYLFPSAIISLGIAFGANEDKNGLGDVVISEKIYPYFVGAKINDEALSIVDDNAFEIGSEFNRIKNLTTENKFRRLEKRLRIKISLGNYLTGEAVVSSQKARDAFLHITTQEIKAGDMEGYGLFKECKDKNVLIPCLTIKSICDWGVAKNFNEKNNKALSKFKEVVSEKLDEKDKAKLRHENYIELLRTLKDRIQAVASSYAFETLNAIIIEKALDNSLIYSLKEWIKGFNGTTTSCDKLKNKAINELKLKGGGVSLTNEYIHSCVLVLYNEGYIKCEKDCLNHLMTCNDMLDCHTIEVTKKGET